MTNNWYSWYAPELRRTNNEWNANPDWWKWASGYVDKGPSSCVIQILGVLESNDQIDIGGKVYDMIVKKPWTWEYLTSFNNIAPFIDFDYAT